MRGRSLLAALAGAGLVLLCGGLTLPPAYAQDDPAAEADPNSGGAGPADQQSTPIPAADTAEPAAAPADDAAQPSAEAQTATPADATPSPDATPIVASIRGKLQDPAVAKTANAQDLAALVAFYGTRSDPVWMTDMGFSSEAPDHHRRSITRRRLGTLQRGLRSPFRGRSSRTRSMSRPWPRSSSTSPF